MLDVDLSPYDYIIATPPCNYWSRANYQREQSEYAQKTKHLLPMILDKLIKLNKPFIVENVRNSRLFNKYKLYNFPCFVYKVGRHTYWTNMMFNPMFVPQLFDFKKGRYHLHSASGMQGGKNVHEVFELWLKQLTENKGEE